MKLSREDALMPGGVPRYIRCYDSGPNGSADRYTVLYTGRTGKQHLYVGMSANPFHPQGVGQHGESDHLIDYPTYSHLGKKIRFENLPPDCQKVVVSDYKEIWKL
jgi:hypothetical protein